MLRFKAFYWPCLFLELPITAKSHNSNQNSRLSLSALRLAKSTYYCLADFKISSLIYDIHKLKNRRLLKVVNNCLYLTNDFFTT